MDEANNNTPKEGENNNPTAGQQPEQNTSPQAVNVDINAIISQAEIKAMEAAEKKMEAVFKSILEQKGLDAESIKKMTDEWRANQVTPEQTIQTLQGELAKTQSEITDYKDSDILRGHGMTDPEEVAIMLIRIRQIASKKGEDFAPVADEYFKAHPYQKRPAAAAVPGVTGFTPMSPQKNEKDMTYAERYKLKHNT
ncbi:MAG: hypothetical protein FWH10_08560 [Oscillospiraceae bacterium]|nr:hypothetical protein [Oscillospiraceae bacterium]